ncbi:MAG: hypothetical protein ACU83V_11015 [Gammaproteobacteria bacterium]
MNIINLRKNVRRAADTRPNSDRRSGSNPLSAAEMQEKMQKGETSYPKFNRRKAERRTKDRRSPVSASQHESDQHIPRGTKYARFLLTRGERNLIQDMFLSDLDKE